MAVRVDQAELCLPLLLGRVHAEILRRYTAAARSADCPIEEWWVLSCLATRGGRPMSEIAEYAGMPNPSLTKVVDRMVAANLVFRRVDPEDRRRTLLYLTTRGQEKHTEVAVAVADAEAEMRAAAGEDPVGTLHAVLAGLAPALLP
jgi:DNA-binding MarR family transcriptional regulator